MSTILIAAIATGGFIAKHSRDTLSWTRDKHLFKKQTMGHRVIMGSTTANIIGQDLPGRDVVIVHRHDSPDELLPKGDQLCFIAGGSRTNTFFLPHVTHIYLTIHPILLGSGLPLFYDQKSPLNLSLQHIEPVPNEPGLSQYQYIVLDN